MPRKSQLNGGLTALMAKSPEFEDWTVKSTTQIATLWSNYGSIVRIALQSLHTGKAERYVIVKTVTPPRTNPHSTDESHLRKLLSYEVERWFYYNLANRLPSTAMVATPYPLEEEYRTESAIRLLMEDLSVDYPVPARGSLNLDDTKSVLSWLATFHGTFWGVHHEDAVRDCQVPPPLEHKSGQKQCIWQQGTYWYLDTRRSEFADIGGDETWILDWAEKVDSKIKKESKIYGTLLHGDAKGANILFAPAPKKAADQPRKCALYDFQYVGNGLATRDLVYFLGTTVHGGIVRRLEDEKSVLKYYHAEFHKVIESRRHSSPEVTRFFEDLGEYTFDKFWEHWEITVVDWYRFMAGWGFWGNDQWIDRRAREITARWTHEGFDEVHG